MSSNKELIPFTTFSRDCFFEEGMDSDLVFKNAPDEKNSISHLTTKEEIIEQATIKRLGKYRATMEAFSINFELLKENNHVLLPNSQIESVKWIINNYTGSVIKNYRSIFNKVKKTFDSKESDAINHKFIRGSRNVVVPNSLREEFNTPLKQTDLIELRTVINHISSILKAQLSESELRKELNSLYRNSLVLFKEVLIQVNDEIVPSIIKQVENTMYFAQNGNTLDDLDRLILLQYYMSLINQVNEQFRNITKITVELREEELVNISVVESDDPDDQVSDHIDLQFLDFHEILEQAIEIYKEE